MLDPSSEEDRVSRPKKITKKKGSGALRLAIQEAGAQQAPPADTAGKWKASVSEE